MSFLVSKKTGFDAELDSLFEAPVAKSAIPGPSKETKKRKLRVDQDKVEEVEKSSKRPKGPLKSANPKVVGDKLTTLKKTESATPDAHKNTSSKELKLKSKKGKEKESLSESDEENDDLENAYLTNKKPAPSASNDNAESDVSEEGIDLSTLVHESLEKSPKKKSSRSKKTKIVPADETPEKRDQRTIFVGNVPLEVASKKSLNKQLQRHILSFLSTAKIESIRFRSIAFQNPTNKLPTSDDEDGKSQKHKPKKELRLHEKERASGWKAKLDDEDDVKKDEKRYLTPAQKKRVAFINQEFHSSADSVNAYVVFAHPPNTENRPANLPPLPPTMDPYEAARLAVEKCHGTIFMERMLRVDLVTKNSKDYVGDHESLPNFGTDPRMCVFVGNLDFASKEEDLRIFFEGVLTTERGPTPIVPEQKDLGNSETQNPSSKKPATWVSRVRIIRDKDTQLGKGFAYVQFADRECVDELVALEQDKLKFAKRKLRVQRCKTLPGSAAPVVPHTHRPSRKVNPTVTKGVAPVTVPKGDPSLGEKLAGLSKEQRKQLKSSDADRLARRLAKKKARMNMKPNVGKSKSSKVDGKIRKRVRSRS